MNKALIALAVERLTTRELLTEGELAPEVAKLIKTVFPRLTEADKKRVLDALTPPDFSWMQNAEFESSRRATWRRDRLALIAEHLPREEAAELAQLIAAEGEPESIRTRKPVIASWSGLQSPLNEEEIQTMGLPDLLRFLAQWTPEPGFRQATRRGLGQQLQRLVADDPVGHSHWAVEFIGQLPVYVDSILNGFRTAARSGKPFSWPDILALSEWVVTQPTIEDDLRPDLSEEEPDWRHTRRTIADLIGVGLGGSTDEPTIIPFSERTRVWRIIEPLTRDSNPSAAFEAGWGGTERDPTAIAINTVRPEAIDAAIRYAFWQEQNKTGKQIGLRGVLRKHRRVTRLLAFHLDPENDPSLGVRAAIGHWLTSLSRTDPEWIKNHLDSLLPAAPEMAAYRDALWDAFIIYSQPHPDALGILHSEYRDAINRSASDPSAAQRRLYERLAEHIVALYWWGAVSLEDSDLISHLFTTGSVGLRAHALQHIGFSLYHSKVPVPAEQLDRLSKLWEWRAGRILEGDLTERQPSNEIHAELKTFGWWFASGAFDPTWAITWLTRVLSRCGNVDLEHAAADKLGEIAEHNLNLSAMALLAVDYSGGDEPWLARSWLEILPSFVDAAKSSRDPQILAMTREVLNRVVAAGHTELRVLLP